MGKKSDRLLVAPSSKESEMMVLGCMLTSNNALNIGADGLKESDCYHTEHGVVCTAPKDPSANHTPVHIHLIEHKV